MPSIRYIGPFDEVSVDGVGVVKHGDTLEVASDELAKSLLKQADNWAAPAKKSTNDKQES